MFDEDGVPKDKFFTKPADKVMTDYFQNLFRFSLHLHQNLFATLQLFRVPKIISFGKWYFLLILINLR